ncbi:hypothetical protein HYQ46_008877 [Verticillium longisporum]|nr:hypothetical protein HYQ46_008877 [Verticillium longisporum]
MANGQTDMTIANNTRLISQPLALALNGPHSLEHDAHGTPNPHEKPTGEVRELIGTDNVRVPKTRGQRVDDVCDLIALGVAEGRNLRGQRGRTRARDEFKLGHGGGALYNVLVVVEHGNGISACGG